MPAIRVNGRDETLSAPDDKPLLWVLREDVGLKGTKYGCGVGMCGACTILLNGQAVRACVTPLSAAEGGEIQTIESLNDELGSALKTAWVESGVAQCGYCQPGQLVAAYDLLNRRVAGAELRLKETLTNICRCGTYGRIHAAISDVAAAIDEGNNP